MIKMGSLFDGIGGWPLAAEKCGVIPVWSSEIETFPLKVTARHFPKMIQLGDITNIDGTKIEPVDIITFGSPCQDLSIAGKRGGLEGARSGLFNEAVRIIREMRLSSGGKYPRFAIWENVPGAFSSNKGMDFRTVLEEITETKIPMPRSKRWATAGMVRSNKCEVAWRVLDAQYWGVPQRRKRIFLVADFGGRCAGEILFKPESVQRYFAEGCGERKSVATNVENSTGATILRMRSGKEGGGKGALVSEEKSLTLATGNDQILFSCGGFSNYKKDNVTATQRASLMKQSDVDLILQLIVMQHPITLANVASTLRAGAGTPKHAADEKGRLVLQLAYCIAGNTIDRKIENGGNGKGVNREVSFTLNTIDRHAVAYPSISFSQYGDDKVACTLRASGGNLGGGSENLVVYGIGNGQADQIKLHKKISTLSCMHDQQAVIVNYKVRRLTPIECERLQGLKDGWTNGGSDTARYKALGNGMAQPCPDYVMEGIVDVLKNNKFNEFGVKVKK